MTSGASELRAQIILIVLQWADVLRNSAVTRRPMQCRPTIIRLYLSLNRVLPPKIIMNSTVRHNIDSQHQKLRTELAEINYVDSLSRVEEMPANMCCSLTFKMTDKATIQRTKSKNFAGCKTCADLLLIFFEFIIKSLKQKILNQKR